MISAVRTNGAARCLSKYRRGRADGTDGWWFENFAMTADAAFYRRLLLTTRSEFCLRHNVSSGITCWSSTGDTQPDSSLVDVIRQQSWRQRTAPRGVIPPTPPPVRGYCPVAGTHGVTGRPWRAGLIDSCTKGPLMHARTHERTDGRTVARGAHRHASPNLIVTVWWW